MARIGGVISVRMNGEQVRAKGSWEFGLGQPMREAVIGADAPHGYKETPQVAFISGATSDHADLDLQALFAAEDVTVTLELATGKTIVLRNAWFAGEGTGSTEEGEIAVRFESLAPAEVLAA